MTALEMEAALAAAGIDSPRLEASLLFEHFEGISPAEYLWRSRAKPPLTVNTSELAAALGRRLSHEPMAYILGEAFFYGRPFKVTPDCLIPRSDTETLVDIALGELPHGAHIYDLCTGSGCIGLTLLCERPDITATLADISEGALRMAEENAERLGVTHRASFIRRDLLTRPLIEGEPELILSNPPYIPPEVIEELSAEVKREPRLALDGGEDGLVFYRTITAAYPHTRIIYEIGYDQAEALRTIAAEQGRSCRIFKDAGGNDRVAAIAARQEAGEN